jgi:hypothetical protein
MKASAAIGLLMFAAGSGHADPAALARCRQVADAGQRLACYDAIALTPNSGSVVPTTGDTHARAATAAAAAPAAASRRDPASFGLPDSAPDADLEAIESMLADDIDGWRPNGLIRLANGQIWQIADDSSGVVRPGKKKVRVRRGVLGAFYIEFEGLNRSPRVRRLQ